MYDPSHFTLRDQVAVITGGGAGIGRAIAETFAAAGAAVVVSDLDVNTAELVADQIRQRGGKAAAVACDVTQESDLSALVHQATLQFMSDGRLAGSTGCNRLIGSYEVKGKQLKVQPAGSTMMACPSALMMQERKLLDLLPALRQFQLDATGALILQTEGSAKVVARRR